MNKLKLPTMNRRLTQDLVLLGILLILMVFLTVMNPRFFSERNFINLVRQVLPVVLMGCAMTLVINSGAIDLSVGAMMGLSAVMFGTFCTWGINVWVSVALACLLGVVMGIVNTLLVHGLQLPSIMATMATWIGGSGLAYSIVSAIPVRDPQLRIVAELNTLMFFNDTIPLAVFIILAVVALFLILEKKTIVGKYAISIGGNENAAFLSGINVTWMRLIFFALSGVMAAFSGVWQVSRIGSGDPTIGMGMEFSVIAGCILGGVNIKGGDGTITGMLIGTATLAILVNGMNMLGINAFYQQVATGVVLLIAVLTNYGASYLRTRTRRQTNLLQAVSSNG
jgi:ribose/xylose/arabinose/galactoside ABC-type transport system permease subunit